MSWMKRPQGGGAPPVPERQPYPSSQAQPYGNQQNMYPNHQAGSGGTAPQQQYWQGPPQGPQYGQQYGQAYQQQDYPCNANQFYQKPHQYNQNFTNEGYAAPQQSYQQNYYQNRAPQQNFTQKPSDGWEENWDWGWEDSSKQGQIIAQSGVCQPHPAQQQQQQQQFNNANIIEESFAATDTWNWAMDDKKAVKTEPIGMAQVQDHKEPPVLPIANSVLESKIVSEPHPPRSTSNTSAQHNDDVKTLNDREIVKECLPSLALGKRFHLDNLTPQWSIESQMSQESSDGPHTHSEGTYRSENQSRNSNKSSPDLNTDNSNFNYSQPPLEENTPQNSEWSRPSEEQSLSETLQRSSRRESYDELSNSLQEMNLTNNENPAVIDSILKNVKESVSQQLAPVISSNFPHPMASNLQPPPTSSVMPPPPLVSSVSLPPAPTSSVTISAPPSSSSHPPSNFLPPTSNQNPFKHAGPFSHKSITKGPPSTTAVQSFTPQMSGINLTSPAVVTKVTQQTRAPVGFEANLETTPDNSERPDQPQLSAFRPVPMSHQVPDNLEVAPRSDRNEYLQTAHLSSGDYGENTDFSQGLPPPGLRRMVVGQPEPEYNQALNSSGDEPPPGLARMVPGQQTELESYNQSSDNYMNRHIDGQRTDNGARPYRQADGQQTPDIYTQQVPNRAAERRPIGLDRLVPGEPSNDEYPQYQTPNYGTNDERVVTGLDYDYPMPTDAGPTDIREQNVDGSDYSEQSSRNPPRNIIGARETSNEVPPDFIAPLEEQQREVTMEGENLQDLSNSTTTELTYSREHMLDGADLTLIDVSADRKTDLSDSIEHQASSSRRQSLNRVNTSGEDSERDRAFKASPRRDRDKHKSSRDRDRDRDKEGRYSRGDKKHERDDRRSAGADRRDRDKRVRERDGYRDRRDREREESPDPRRSRRARDHRYETEDTDYYSDRERDRRHRREGSYTSSKPPRPDDKDRRYDDRDRTRRYATIERDRRYDDRDSRRGDKYSDRFERSYRDIDPTKKHGNLRRQREKDVHRRGEQYSPSRTESRGDATATDEDLESRRRRARHRTAEPFYDEYASGGSYADPYLAQRQQYQYYEHLRRTDPAAYMLLYKQLMAGHAPPVPRDYRALYTDDFTSLSYDGRREERGSVHSGRSSTTGLKGHDTYYGAYRRDVTAGSVRDAPSLRADLSDRDLNTDTSLNLHLEESTVRSERMTPFRYSTAHIKGSISSRDVVVVRAAYPVDGAPATVHVVSLRAALAHDPVAADLAAQPGPLVKGVTHKKSVIEYCGARARAAAREGARDPLGYVLVWELLALLLRQNGVVVGTDIAELLMKNTREYAHKASQPNPPDGSRRGSSASGREDGARSSSPDQTSLSVSDTTHQESASSPGQSAAGERAALDRLRDYLLYGNRQEALEWAMSNNLWGHALQLAAYSDRRTRAAVSARFLAALPRTDPLHTLYAALGASMPPAATCVSEARWGDWRPHAAVLLANGSARPDHDTRALTQLGDSLSSRGLIYSAQFCYLSAGLEFTRHPLAPLQAPAAGAPASPPRLALLLADSRSDTLHQLATNRAIFATEVYEYALSLSQEHYAITELQVYKLVLASRLVDCGQYERALQYTEAAARALTRAPHRYSPRLVARLADLADRLKYHDPALQEDPPLADEPDSGEPSPAHHQHWLDDVKALADNLTAGSSPHPATPLHQNHYYLNQQHGWADQSLQYQQPNAPYAERAEEAPDYSAQYYAAPAPAPPPAAEPDQQPYVPLAPHAPYADEWPRAEEHAQTYADPYWQDQTYSYGEAAGGAAGEEARPAITMPGAQQPRVAYPEYEDDRPPSADQQTERENGTPKSTSNKKQDKPKDESKGDAKGKGGGWLGGILNRLSLRPPNQMILPDDKNPSIVWDAEKKRWRNVDGDADEPEQPPPPPPKSRDLPAPAHLGVTPQAAAPAQPVPNIFKMQKGRHIKKSYVDVFNPSGAATRERPPAAEVLGPVAPPPAPTTYFVPAPAHPAQGGVYDPSQMSAADDEQIRSGI